MRDREWEEAREASRIVKCIKAKEDRRRREAAIAKIGWEGDGSRKIWKVT